METFDQIELKKCFRVVIRFVNRILFKKHFNLVFKLFFDYFSYKLIKMK